MRLLKSPECRELDHTNSVFAKCKEASRPKPSKAAQATETLEQRERERVSEQSKQMIAKKKKENGFIIVSRGC